MPAEFKEIFIQILDTIGYEGDKDEYTNKLWNLCSQEIILGLISGLSEENKANLEGNLNDSSTPEDFMKALQVIVPADQYQKMILDTIKKVSGEYIDYIAPTLTEEQLIKLTEYSDSQIAHRQS